MRYLPNLEYLNGLPVDREALDEDEEDESQTNAQAAIQQEAMNNGPGQVLE